MSHRFVLCRESPPCRYTSPRNQDNQSHFPVMCKQDFQRLDRSRKKVKNASRKIVKVNKRILNIVSSFVSPHSNMASSTLNLELFPLTVGILFHFNL